MSREIKFRAWHFNRLEMENDVHLLERLAEIISRPEEYHIMQFTGLLDKAGVEIYEGDVCIYSDPLDGKLKVIIEWHQYGIPAVIHRYVESKSNYCEYDFDHLDMVGKNYEVIGNIYQHHNLLKDGN